MTATPARRLSGFVLGLCLALGILECVVQRNTSLFEAASHRALAKVAMFEMHPTVNFLFLGTSRTQDGVSPDLITRTLSEIAPELGEVAGYNAAFTGSSLDALISLVPHFGFRSGLRVAVIELSDPQIFNESVPWEERPSQSVTLEDRLGDWMRGIHFVRFRKAFLSDNLGRLPALLIFGASLGGWETKGNQQVASWLGRREAPANGFDPALWVPELISPNQSRQELDSSNDAIATKLGTVAHQFQEHGIKVVFAVPPMSQNAQDSPERQALRPLFSEVVSRGRCEVWNFAALSLPEPMFRDRTHLGKAGRAHYSRALGIQLAKVLKGE